MTKGKRTLLIGVKSFIVCAIAMMISLYVSLSYLPRPSIFNIETNPRPIILWEILFPCWVAILIVVGIVIAIKNKFMTKKVDDNSSSPVVEPFISAWVIFLLVALPTGLFTLRIANYFSPSLNNHITYHLTDAIRYNDDVTLTWLLTISNSKQNDRLVDVAVGTGSEACLKVLAFTGRNPKKETLPFIMLQAAAAGNNKLIELMMGYGVSVNFQTSYGQTPLVAAAEQNRPDTVEFLIKKGADINLVPKDAFPPLVVALINDNNKMMESFIKSGIDVKACKLNKEFSLARKVPDQDGKNILTLPSDSTLLMLAAASANVEAVKMLLQAGAQVDRVNSAGYTALMCAKAIACAECEKALVDAGAK